MTVDGAVLAVATTVIISLWGRSYSYGLRPISMTDHYGSLQMRAHYATSYCGACLCFDTSCPEGRIDAARYSDALVVEGGYRADNMYLLVSMELLQG